MYALSCKAQINGHLEKFRRVGKISIWLKVKSNDLIFKSTLFWVYGSKDSLISLHQGAVRSHVRVKLQSSNQWTLRKISQSRNYLNWLKVKSNDLFLKNTLFWVYISMDSPLSLHQSAVKSRVRVSHSGDLEKFRKVGKI